MKAKHNMIRLALYKGPTDDLIHSISHWVTCIVLSIRDMKINKYSHTEIQVDGECFSSSVRDGGVRSKTIDLFSGKWDYIELPNEYTNKALEVFNLKRGNKYDWFGALGFGLPFLKQDTNKDYCFEINAEMLGLDTLKMYSPVDFINYFSKYPLVKISKVNNESTF